METINDVTGAFSLENKEDKKTWRSPRCKQVTIDTTGLKCPSLRCSTQFRDTRYNQRRIVTLAVSAASCKILLSSFPRWTIHSVRREWPFHIDTLSALSIYWTYICASSSALVRVFAPPECKTCLL